MYRFKLILEVIKEENLLNNAKNTGDHLLNRLNELSLCAVEQISARGMKRKQRFYEIIGNERARIGGERKMHRIPTGAALVSLIIKEFIFWRI